MSRHIVPTVIATSLAVAVLSAASVKFTSTWKSPDAGSVTFAGTKMAALVISQDDSLRMSGEEALVRELQGLGLQAVATYRIAPKEELQKPETARPWFERSGVGGVVAVRPVSAETRETYTPATWVGANYNYFWSYYGYGWGAVYIPASTDRETIVIVETTVYSLSNDKLVWAAVSETKNPKDLQRFVGDLVKETVKEMRKQGLARGAVRQ